MGVTLDGFLRCANDAEAERVRAALLEHIRLTRAEPGCIRFEVDPTDDPWVWHVSEAFVDPAAFEAHQARAQATSWATQTQGIARDYTITGMP
ncbi:MAG: putative quinol monooxygenase [Tateyamaria sp.]